MSPIRAFFAVVTLASGYDDRLPMIRDFRGLIYRSPFLGSLLIFFLISLIGIPFTGGFFGQRDSHRHFLPQKAV